MSTRHFIGVADPALDNSGILNWRRWSPIRKAQVVATAFGLLLTAGFMIYDALPIEVPRNWLSAQLWGVGMALGCPTEAVVRLLGLPQTFLPWGGRVLVLSVNGALGFGPGHHPRLGNSDGKTQSEPEEPVKNRSAREGSGS